MCLFSDHKHFNKIISASLRFLYAACGVPMKQRTIITFRVAALVPAFSLFSLYGNSVAALQKKCTRPMAT